MFLQIAQAFNIGIEALLLRIGHEDNPIDPLQDKPAAGIVVDLARHGIKMKADFKSVDQAQLQRQEIEEQCPLRVGGKRHHLSLIGGMDFLIDVIQIGGLAAQTRTVIHNLAIDFP